MQAPGASPGRPFARRHTRAFRIKRIYEPAVSSDGTRVLVDRLWPRGVKKANAHVDLWMKDVAPSPPLRQWFQHDPERFAAFSRRYTNELRGNPEFVELRKLGSGKPVTLLYAAHDPQVNHARVLQAALTRRATPSSTGKPQDDAARKAPTSRARSRARSRPRPAATRAETPGSAPRRPHPGTARRSGRSRPA